MEEELITYLGIDWGGKRIGLAIADNQNNLATPYGVVANLEDVLEVITVENIDKVIIGEPKSLAGNIDDLNSDYLDFYNDLVSHSPAPVIKYDERLSSRAADSLSGSKKEKAPRDAVAAMVILQSYLDYIN